ncbi:RNB-domain-containing protein [Phellopilus nigrolimitatus]|nr:RNB-domain-containing protein [Phellopilus nigrolimitatus]
MLSSSLRRFGTADAAPVHARLASSDVPRILRKKLRPKGSRGDIRDLKDTGKSLIKAVQKGDLDPAWRHTYGNKEVSERLVANLTKAKNSPHLPSVDTGDFFDGHPLEHYTSDDLVQSNTSTLQPGTFFEIRRNSDVITGVVIDASIDNFGYSPDTVSMNIHGEVFKHRASDVMFAVPNFVDAFLAKRCGNESVHENEHELAARLKVLKRARDFDRAVETEQYRLARFFKDLYPQVRADDPDAWGKITTLQAARLLVRSPNIPIVTLFAVHKQLMDRSDQFICHPIRHRFLHTFDVRPDSHLRNLRTVRNWIWERSPVIGNFQKRARWFIDRSRELSQKSENEPPSQIKKAPNDSFRPEELEIIKMLKLSLAQGRRIQLNPYDSVVPSIIKDTFRYDQPTAPHITYKFLQEIGVYTPWEDIASKDKELRLPPDVEQPPESPKVKTTNLSSRSFSATATSGLLTADAHESVRHDFGSLPVYVVDDATAEELDDGVSLEPVINEPGSVWLHVHVADPTTIIPVEHEITREIQKCTESIYLGHRTWPMLPTDIASLCDMGRAGVAGKNVLTFSAKIDTEGAIVDHRVRAGYVRNIHKINYEDVNELIGIPASRHEFMPFELPSVTMKQNVRNNAHISMHSDQLKYMYEISRRLTRNRLNGDVFAFLFSLNRPEITFVDRPVPQNPSESTQPRFYRGFPDLKYTVRTYKYSETGARSLVAEFMKVAGRVASRFCLEHNIPVIRRALPPLAFSSEAQRKRILSSRDETGHVDPLVILKEDIVFPPGELTSKPAAHTGIGVPASEGYARATSPLRRAEDMLAHWQIKNALLPGAARGATPFTEEMLVRLTKDFSNHKLSVKRAYRTYTRHWTHVYIDRFMQRQKRLREQTGGGEIEFEPLRGLEALVLRNPSFDVLQRVSHQDVFIPRLGLTAVMAAKDLVGQEVTARVKVDVKRVFQTDLNQNLEVDFVERLS